jgi:D-alanyl-D-alanine carboxypeptidase/D-alanyl-D-alanine-endopeptidase (penicillin-binding protein 4)
MMKRNIYYLFVCYLLFTSAGSISAQIPPALKTFIQKENLQHAGIGFKAVDLATGQTFAAYNDRSSFTPASNMKIVTTATALDVMGSRFRYETPLFYSGEIQNAVLKGNLYIQGTGDPSLGSEHLDGNREDFLKQWLTDIQKAGIQSIDGDVIVLDQLFGYEGVSPKWMWEDLGNYYAPGIYGISVFDNMYRIYLQSFSPGTKTSVLSIEPEINNLAFTNEIVAGDTKSDESYISGLPFSTERRLYGTIPPNRTTFPVKGDIPDPGLFLANYFKTYLQKNGIEVKGEGTTYRLNQQLPENQQLIAKVQSPDLASIVRIINVKSNNHYAEHLYQTLKIVRETGIPAYWEEKGLDASALFMYDGSGISPLNAVSAGFLTDLLVYMDKKEGQAGAFYQSLPVAGKEGTVAAFLQHTPLNGKAHVKSGSITDVQSYSGYIEKNGKRYAFSLIVNRFTGKRADLRKDMEQLLVNLF